MIQITFMEKNNAINENHFVVSLKPRNVKTVRSFFVCFCCWTVFMKRKTGINVNHETVMSLGQRAECASCVLFCLQLKLKYSLTCCDRLCFHLFRFLSVATTGKKNFPVKQLTFRLISYIIFNYQAVQMQ